MANIYKGIRAALESQLTNIASVPDIAYENVAYDPKTGVSYIEVKFIPVNKRPAVRGLNPQQRYDGVFAINCYVPEGFGPAAADTLANNVMDAFEATTKLTHSDVTVSIDYAERQQGILDAPWYFVPVNIGWYAYN